MICSGFWYLYPLLILQHVRGNGGTDDIDRPSNYDRVEAIRTRAANVSIIVIYVIILSLLPPTPSSILVAVDYLHHPQPRLSAPTASYPSLPSSSS
jgi:hypothetical protein